MPFRIITIPFDPDKEVFQEDPLKQFCLNKMIVSHRAEFFKKADKAFWTVFIEYDVATGDDTPQEGLSDAQRLFYQRMREWRAGKAEEQGVPVFIVATNKLMRAIAIKMPVTLEALKDIKGFGKKKLERYGNEIVEMARTFSKKP